MSLNKDGLRRIGRGSPAAEPRAAGLIEPVRVAEAAEGAARAIPAPLPAQNLIELLLELLLVEQLAARDAVDLRAQLGDAVLVAELHVGLAGDQPGEYVLAEGEIGGGRDASMPP